MATRPWSCRLGWSGLGRAVLLADPAHFTIQQDGAPAFRVDAVQDIACVGDHHGVKLRAGAGADMDGAARDQNRLLAGRLAAGGLGERLRFRVEAEGVERGKVCLAGRPAAMVCLKYFQRLLRLFAELTVLADVRAMRIERLLQPQRAIPFHPQAQRAGRVIADNAAYLTGIEGDGVGTHAVLRASGVDDLRGRSHHRHMGDLVGAAGARVCAEELQVAGLFGHVDDRSPAEALADLGVGSWPEQFKVIVVDLLVARRHAAAVLPALALGGVGAGDEGGTVEDVLLRAPGLAVCAADFG